MSLDPMRQPNPMGQVESDDMGHWCDEHERRECTRRSKRTHERCHASRVRGTDTCIGHAGTRKDVTKAKGEAVTAWRAMNAAGDPLGKVDPGEAVLAILHMSWLRVHLYAGLLERQVVADGLQAAAGTGQGDSFDGAAEEGSVTGLVGHTYAAHPVGGTYATGEAARALATMEAQERERVVRFAKTAHDMGISERQIRVVEEQGAVLASVIQGAFGMVLGELLGMLSDQREASEMIQSVWSGLVERSVLSQIEAARVAEIGGGRA